MEQAIKIMKEDLLTTTEAMERAGVSRTTLRNAIADGRLHGVMRGRNLFIPTADIDRFKPISREEAGRKGARSKWEKHRRSELQRLRFVGEPRRRSPKASQALYAEAERFAVNVLQLKERLHAEEEKQERGRPRKEEVERRQRRQERLTGLHAQLAELNKSLASLLQHEDDSEVLRPSADGIKEGEKR
jgi:excisionase family DNA binding protein